jgi:hypothetical protein
VPTFYQLPETLDIAIRTFDPTIIVPSGLHHKDASTHILLAACREEEVAYETISAQGQAYGVFTRDLVKQLHQVAHGRITYSALFDALPDLVYQHPQCEGTNRHRFLFNNKSVDRDPRAFKLTKGDGGTFVVQVGSVGGVVFGTEFAIQAQESTPEDSHILIAISVDTHSSVLAPQPGGVEGLGVEECRAHLKGLRPVGYQADQRAVP